VGGSLVLDSGCRVDLRFGRQGEDVGRALVGAVASGELRAVAAKGRDAAGRRLLARRVDLDAVASRVLGRAVVDRAGVDQRVSDVLADPRQLSFGDHSGATVAIERGAPMSPPDA